MMKREDAFAAALKQKKTALDAKKAEYEMMRKAAYLTNPRLSELDRLLSAAGAEIAMTAISGDSETLALLQTQLSALSAEKKTLLRSAQVSEITYDCPLCKDTGYIGGKICDCVKKLAKQYTLDTLSAEMPLDDCRFDNFDLNYYETTSEGGGNPRKKMTGIFQLCREYALHFDPHTAANLLFMGKAGLGKTHLTLAIVSEVVEKGYEVVYGSAFNLFSAVEKEHFSAEKGDSYETMLACDLLVIDDLGTEFISPFTQTVLYGLINSRLLSKKPTIINTNLEMPEINQRYGQRISSRLIGNYVGKFFCGKDIRQQKMAEHSTND